MIHKITYHTLLEKFYGSIYDVDRKLLMDESGLKKAIESLSRQIYDFGVKNSDRVVLSCLSPVFFIISFFSLLRINAVPVLLPGQITLYELNLLDNQGDFLCVISDQDRWKDSFSTHQPLTFSDYEGYLYLIKNETKPLKELSGMICQPTSGTTGTVKICVRDEYGCIAEPVNHAKTVECRPASIYCPLALNHAYGFGTAFLQAFLSSSMLYLSSSVNPRTIINLFHEKAIDLFTATSNIVELLSEAKISKEIFIPRYIYTAGSPLEKSVAGNFYQRFNKNVFASYGSTETGEMCIERIEGIYETGNVGKPLAYTKIRLKADEEYQYIQVSNPSQMFGYLNEKGLIEKPFLEEGIWHSTGDVGHEDSAGRILVQGRKNNLINVFGKKVNPTEVECFIKTINGVKDVAVFAGHHRSGSELVYALVQCSDSLKIEDIITKCKHNLMHYKVPVKIKRVAEIPRNISGKLIKNKISLLPSNVKE